MRPVQGDVSSNSTPFPLPPGGGWGKGTREHADKNWCGWTNNKILVVGRKGGNKSLWTGQGFAAPSSNNTTCETEKPRTRLVLLTHSWAASLLFLSLAFPCPFSFPPIAGGLISEGKEKKKKTSPNNPGPSLSQARRLTSSELNFPKLLQTVLCVD